MTARRSLLGLLAVLAAVLGFSVLGLAGSADAATRASAPAGLHPFLLRVDEPRSDSFSRTPSFAWKPVAGALRYEFQLSTSGAFRDSGIVFSDTTLTSPVAAPPLTLPWITGSPHALYARVRAVLEDTTTPWSASVGFDMEPSAVPAPLPSYPGLVRWTPVDGAAAYQVWFVDVPKMVITTTNVADQREFYSFHQAASWLGQVRWRVRALRDDFNGRSNGLPAAGAGPWSPVYTSVNPPFAVGPLRPTATVSDTVATGAASAPAHRLMPAFVFGGSQPVLGAATELYRVHVFTDRRCVNRVYTGAIVGSPAYAPRVSGPLALPRSSTAIAGARLSYLGDGDEGPSFLGDLDKVVANESLPDVKPTTGLPGVAPAAAPTAPATGTAPAAPAAAASTPAAVVELLKASGSFGPPVDIWDTDWSNGGGYYWTVIGVEATVPGASSTSVAGAGAALGASTIPVSSGLGFTVGDAISVGNPGNVEAATVTSVTADSIGVATPLKAAHGAGEPVSRTSGNIQYRDAELAQDVCAAGRVLRFGKESEPALTSGGEPFVSGLSPTGRLASASARPAFYGSPLVAWTTALGSSAYAVQWSKTRQPFVPAADPATGALGMLTVNTSAVLPLEPGTWYYRVRGYSFSLPTGSQAMTWSEPQKVVATRPTFAVVGGTAPAATTKEVRVTAGGFSVRVPKSWSSTSRAVSGGSAKLAPAGASGSALRLTVRDAHRAALFVQTKAERADGTHAAWARRVTAATKRLPGRIGAVRCANVPLAAGAAVRCTLATRVAGSRQHAVVYLLRHRSATYTLTFATSARGAQASAIAAAARSFRFTS